MAKDLAVFDEATAKDVLETIKLIKASGLLGPQSESQPGSVGQQVWNTPAPTLVYNDSGATVPPYGLMQMAGTLDEDGRNYIQIKRPIDTSLARCLQRSPLLINGPTEIAVNGYGCAQQGPEYRLLTDGGTYVEGDRLGAKNSTFTATYGALFAFIGYDEIDDDIAKVKFDTSAFKGRTKAVPLVAGVPGNVYFRDADGTATTREYLAETDESDIPANTNIWLFPMYGRLVAAKVC